MCLISWKLVLTPALLKKRPIWIKNRANIKNKSWELKKIFPSKKSRGPWPPLPPRWRGPWESKHSWLQNCLYISNFWETRFKMNTKKLTILKSIMLKKHVIEAHQGILQTVCMLWQCSCVKRKITHRPFLQTIQLRH